jgi:hypothetical protein
MDHLFTLFYRLHDNSRLQIQAFHTGQYDERGTSRITIRAIHFRDRRCIDEHFGAPCQQSSHRRPIRRVVWEAGQTWFHPSPSDSDDGKMARKYATELVSIRPGDTDPEFFKDYTADQLHFAEYYGEELSCMAMMRYGDD